MKQNKRYAKALAVICIMGLTLVYNAELKNMTVKKVHVYTENEQVAEKYTVRASVYQIAKTAVKYGISRLLLNN
ncbi:MAG: hypothetical protein PHH37_00050 [Paludibacter sp.]|nr:hypothetical protein [Paludibacter sp.]